MHMQGEPRTMQRAPRYVDVVKRGQGIPRRARAGLQAAGMARERIRIDPGFGFGKTLAHNLQLLRHLEELGRERWPLARGPVAKVDAGAPCRAAPLPSG